MNNAEKFKETFGMYATELWAMPESEFLKWLNSLHDVNVTNATDTISRQDAVKDRELVYEDGEVYEVVRVDTLMELPSAEPQWNNHTVACLLADMFGDTCACNYNGIDEWLPFYCDFSNTVCPHTVGVACWEQFLTHRDKRAERRGGRMTPEEFKNKMLEIVDEYDEEIAHSMADGLMCDLLRELGYGEGVDVFEDMDKWYA